MGETLSEMFATAFMFGWAFMPGPLRFTGPLPGRSKGRGIPTTPGREKIIRSVAFAAGLVIAIDAILRLIGKPPILK